MLVSSTSPLSTTTAWLPTLTAYSTPTLQLAALPRHLRDTRQPLAFFSRKLLSAEPRYSTFNTVLLAFRYAVRHFRHLIEGTSFSIQTDHLPLVHAFNKKPAPALPDNSVICLRLQNSTILVHGTASRYTTCLSPLCRPSSPLVSSSAPSTHLQTTFSTELLAIVPFNDIASISSWTSAPAVLALGFLFSSVDTSSAIFSDRTDCHRHQSLRHQYWQSLQSSLF